MEVDILEVGHILCIGDLQDVRAMSEAVSRLYRRGSFIPFADF